MLPALTFLEMWIEISYAKPWKTCIC